MNLGVRILTGVASSIGVIASISAGAISEQRKEIERSLTEPPYLVEGPLASVIIPALEEENYLPPLLTSIQNQTYKTIEVIVIDQSPPESHERTVAICLEYGARCISIPETNVARARNEGARAATSDILIFSDADNVLAPECVESLVRTLMEGWILANPVHCMIDGGVGAFGPLLRNNWFKSSSRTLSCVAIWRAPYFEVGGYDESCDPMQGCREDLKLGKDVVERFGAASTRLVRDALVGTSARRWGKEGYSMWKSRGVRDHIIEY